MVSASTTPICSLCNRPCGKNVFYTKNYYPLCEDCYRGTRTRGCDICGIDIFVNMDMYYDTVTKLLLCHDCAVNVDEAVTRTATADFQPISPQCAATPYVVEVATPTGTTYKSGYAEKKITGCPVYNEGDTVHIPIEYWDALHALMEACEGMEWLAYLIGEAKGNNVYVNDIYVPEQEVGTAHCRNKEPEPKGTIGIVHSHHDMFKEHSSIDASGIDIQNRVSIVISTKGYSITTRRELPCGRFVVLEGKLNITHKSANHEKWIKESKAKMKQSQYNVQHQQQYFDWNKWANFS